MQPLKIRQVVKGLPDEELDEGIDEGHNEKIARNITSKYKEYKDAYIKYFNDENYKKEDSLNEKGGKMRAADWAVKENAINKKIKQYGTF